MQKMIFLFLMITGTAVACHNNPSASAMASVDSAAKAAPDTLKPSGDTTTRKPEMR
jgi:hypothetical protein